MAPWQGFGDSFAFWCIPRRSPALESKQSICVGCGSRAKWQVDHVDHIPTSSMCARVRKHPLSKLTKSKDRKPTIKKEEDSSPALKTFPLCLKAALWKKSATQAMHPKTKLQARSIQVDIRWLRSLSFLGGLGAFLLSVWFRLLITSSTHLVYSHGDARCSCIGHGRCLLFRCGKVSRVVGLSWDHAFQTLARKMLHVCFMCMSCDSHLRIWTSHSRLSRPSLLFDLRVETWLREPAGRRAGWPQVPSSFSWSGFMEVSWYMVLLDFPHLANRG